MHPSGRHPSGAATPSAGRQGRGVRGREGRDTRLGRVRQTLPALRSAPRHGACRRTGRRAARALLTGGLLSAALGVALPDGLSAAADAYAVPSGPAPVTPYRRAAAEGRDGPGGQAGCGRQESGGAPLTARAGGAPGEYAAGDGWRGWQLELRNTADAACTDVHPAVVLAAERHGLQPDMIRLEFRDQTTGDWLPVPFAPTDRHEQIGVLGKGGTGPNGGAGGGSRAGHGLTVPAHGATAVPVRMRFARDTPRDRVAAGVTTDRRSEGGGAGAKPSGDYAFTVYSDAGPTIPYDPSFPVAPARADAPVSPLTGPARADGWFQVPGAAPQLAATGQVPMFGLGAAAAALLMSGGLLKAGARRLRR
ncbi:hypothetical protein [Streptomyces sp. NPDC048644]|uniref:hypothetical protein n=1 Tax=Streptomyces sp. NPDC048644 TaxID=3365582 RepID=UPI00371FAE91